MSQPTAIVVDDSPGEASIMVGILNGLGVRVEIAANDGSQGWLAIEQMKPTIVTLDVNLPMMNGIEIARAIREKNIPTKIVMCTAMKLLAVQRQLDAIGVDLFVKKPYDTIITAKQLGTLLNG